MNRKKRILSLIVAIVMVMAFIPIVATATAPTATADWYDAGATDLYINNENDFMAFGAAVKAPGNGNSRFSGQVVHLMADLDMSEVSGATWNSTIGRNRGFQGIFDGHGHTISNLKWASTGNDGNTNAGLLCGFISGGAYNSTYGANAGIVNLSMVNCSLSNEAINNGGVAGYAKGNVLLKNLYLDIAVTANVTGKTEAYQESAGGVLGYADASAQLTMDSVAYVGTVTGKNQYAQRVGGLIGQTFYTAGTTQTFLRNCGFFGTIQHDNEDATSSDYWSGFIGVVAGARQPSDFQITGCIVAGTFAFKGGSRANMAVIANSSARLYYKNGIINNTALGVAGPVNGGTSYLSTTEGYISDTVFNNRKPSALRTITQYELADTLNMTNWVAVSGGMPMPAGVMRLDSVAKTVNDARTAENNDVDLTTEFVGYQIRAVANEDKYDLRLVAVFNGELTDYNGVGFEIFCLNNKGEALDLGSQTVTRVYTSVEVASGTKTADELGGDYLYVATVSGIVANKGVLTLAVKTYNINASDQKTYNDICVVHFNTADQTVTEPVYN